jgi:hypothetical protein
MRWVGRVAGTGENGNIYWGLVGKPEGTSPFGRSNDRWEHIKIDL